MGEIFSHALSLPDLIFLVSLSLSLSAAIGGERRAVVTAPLGSTWIQWRGGGPRTSAASGASHPSATPDLVAWRWPAPLDSAGLGSVVALAPWQRGCDNGAVGWRCGVETTGSLKTKPSRIGVGEIFSRALSLPDLIFLVFLSLSRWPRSAARGEQWLRRPRQRLDPAAWRRPADLGGERQAVAHTPRPRRIRRCDGCPRPSAAPD